MNENQKEVDAVGDIIRREKRRRAVAFQAKVVGWLIVVLLVISFVLLFTNIVH